MINAYTLARQYFWLKKRVNQILRTVNYLIKSRPAFWLEQAEESF